MRSRSDSLAAKSGVGPLVVAVVVVVGVGGALGGDGVAIGCGLSGPPVTRTGWELFPVGSGGKVAADTRIFTSCWGGARPLWRMIGCFPVGEGRITLGVAVGAGDWLAAAIGWTAGAGPVVEG